MAYPGNVSTALQVDPVAAQDPEYLAFMRGAGYDETEVMAELARKQAGLGRQIDRARPRFADNLRQAQTGVQQDFTNRGLFRSGARMVGEVDQMNDVRRQQLEFESGIRDQQGDLVADSMKQIASGRREAADRALAGRTNAALNAANASGGYPSPNPPGGGGGGAPGGSGGPAAPRPNMGFRRPANKASTVGGRGAI